MNRLSKIEMAKMVLTEDKKNKITDILRSFYGVTDVKYRDLTYGISIDVSGTNNFRFIKSAIIKVLEVSDDTIGVLGESEKTASASYVYLPEKDRGLHKKLKKLV
jgi:hypothetical protein